LEIIGLSGYARSGKDEAAKVLVEEFGFTRVAFADKLRDFLFALNPLVVEDSSVGFGDVRPLQDVIVKFGWDGYKATPWGQEIRRLLQRLGTEAGRETMWDSIWIDAALTGYNDDAKIVVTDARFPNEAEAIVDRGGELWRVQRTGVGPANSHPSETSLDNFAGFSAVLYNNGTLDEYRSKIRSAYASRL